MEIPDTVRRSERYIKQGEFSTSDLTFRKFYWSLLKQAVPTLDESKVKWVFMLRSSWSSKTLKTLIFLIRRQWWWLMERLPSTSEWAEDELGPIPIGGSYHVTFVFYKDGSSECMVLFLRNEGSLDARIAVRQPIRSFDHRDLSKRLLIFPEAQGQ